MTVGFIEIVVGLVLLCAAYPISRYLYFPGRWFRLRVKPPHTRGVWITATDFITVGVFAVIGFTIAASGLARLA